MLRNILRLFGWYGAIVMAFILAKIGFIAYNFDIYHDYSVTELAATLWHGLSMDLSMAAYLTVIPAIGLAVWTAITASPRTARVWRVGWCVYRYVVAAILVGACVTDAALYPHWGFKLDTTPIFYFITSPGAAAASTSWWWNAIGIALTAVLTWGVGYGLGWVWRKVGTIKETWSARRVWRCIAAVVFSGLLFIPIRGGFTVSTMNPSRAYFSTEIPLNHAATNPLFNLIYTALHQDNFGDEFRYFAPAEAHRLFAELNTPIDNTASRIRLTSVDRPDIVIVILESFSADLMPSLGGSAVATNLDKTAREGLLFTECYASSFRTDRALPAILSAYPAQPTTSLMKYTQITDRLPSIARSLKNERGYHTYYYYGGDANFTNMMSYLQAQHYDRIVSDKDFDCKHNKWGAPDHEVWARMIADMQSGAVASPSLRVVQTSSSHEPFDVPYKSRTQTDEKLNAFEYADVSLQKFIDALKADPSRWDRTLVFITADHWGRLNDRENDARRRHHIPLVVTGGALTPQLRGHRVSHVVSQTDIAATILSELGISTSAFPFSHDMMSEQSPRYAFFSEPDIAGLVTTGGTLTIDLHTGAWQRVCGNPAQKDANHAKAYLQTIYDDLSRR